MPTIYSRNGSNAMHVIDKDAVRAIWQRHECISASLSVMRRGCLPGRLGASGNGGYGKGAIGTTAA